MNIMHHSSQAARFNQSWRSFLYSSVVALGLVWSVAVVTPAQAVTATIVTGTVEYPDGTPLPNFQLELFGVANVSLGTTETNSAGAYSFSVDDTGLTNQELHVELDEAAPDGYSLPGSANSQYFFTYTGTTKNGPAFTLSYLRKYIDVTVVDDQGTLREVDAAAYPLFQSFHNGDTGTIGSSGSLTVEESGKYLVTGDCNLSSSASQCPFIVTNPGQVVEFVEANDVEEHVAITIRLTFATVTVTGQFLDANGNNIYQGGFQPDINFTGYNKDYGVISTRRKVGFDGTVSLKLIPGVWTALPSTGELGVAYESQTFYPADATFVLAEPGSDVTETAYDFGAVQAVANTGSIAGSLQQVSLTSASATPQALDHVELVATNTTNGRHYQTTTDNSGNFTFLDLSFGDFAVTVDSDDYIPVQSAYAVVTATEPTVTGVTVEVLGTDTTISGTVYDGLTPQTFLPGVVVATDETGHTYTTSVDTNGSYALHVPSEQLSSDQLEIQLITQPGADVFMSAPETVTVVADTTITTDLTVSGDEATLSGTLNNAQGEMMVTELGNNTTVMAINTQSGSVEEATVGTDGTWSMQVGAGEWQIIPQVNDPAATVVTNDMSNKAVEVSAAEVSTDIELRVLEAAGTVTGTLTDPNGAALAEVPVMISNLPALQAEAAANGTEVNQSKVVEVTTTTDVNGDYTQNLPTGSYTAQFLSNPDASDLVQPSTEEFNVKAEQTKTVDAEYVEADKTITGEVTVDDITQVSVVAYQADGGMRELTVDSGDNSYSGELTAGEWTIVTSGIKNDNLFTDTDTVEVQGDSTTYNPKPTDTEVAVPATASVSGSASSAVVLSNTEGASVSIPAYAVGQSGTFTAELVPDPQVVVNGGTAQVGLAYDVNIVDSTTDRSVTQLFRPISVHLPIDNTSGEDVTADELSAAFYDPDLQAYLSDGMTAQTNGDEMVLTTTHLTRFAATTLSTLADDVPTKARQLDAKKLKATSTQLTWQASRNSVVTHYKLQLRKKGVAAKAKWEIYNNVTKLKKAVSGLSSKTRYQFRLKACNDTGCSGFTNWEKFTTK